MVKIRQLNSLAADYVNARPALRRSLLIAFWSCVVSLLLFASLVLTIRWVVLPQVGRYTEQIEQRISTVLQAKVRIGSIEPSWEGFWPRLVLKRVRVFRGQGQQEASLALPQVDACFYWKTLLGTPAFRALRISQPTLNIERLSDSVYEIGGFRIDVNETDGAKKAQGTSSSLQFLASQGRIDFINAKVSYADRRTQPVERIFVQNLNASFSHSIRHWNFGLQADYLGEPIDLRVQLERPLLASTSDWRTWAGKLYAKIESFECAPAIKLFSLLSPISRGRGSGEIWAEFNKGEITALSTDLLLEEVEGRFGKDLKPIRARQLEGRLSSVLKGTTLKANLEHLAWILPNGRSIGPFSGALQVEFDKTFSSTLRGNLTLSDINLDSISRTISESFSLPEVIRKASRELSPRGRLSNIRASWEGPYEKFTDWQLESDFSKLSIRPIVRKGQVGQPGFKNLSGTFRISPKQGHASLTELTQVSLPGVFEFPNITLSKFGATLDWKIPRGDTPITVCFKDVTVENPDLALAVSGQWTSAKNGPGTIRLDGKIDRLKAAAAWRYMPLSISNDTRLWLEGALRDGQARNATVIVHGPLQDFPWANSKSDKEHFLIEGNIQNGLLDFMPEEKRPADGQWKVGKTWPVVSGINGTIRFEGALMDIRATSAKTHGATSSFVSAVIPDLMADITQLNIKAKAQGALADMARYLEDSPVGAMLGNAFSEAKATGNAKLDLALHIPLQQSERTKVGGTVFFEDNTLTLHRPVPPLSDVKGELHFTQSGASATGLQARALDTQLGIDVSTDSKGAVRIDVAGSIDPKCLVYFNETDFLRTVLAPLSGTTPTKAAITIDPKKGTIITATSDLTGVTSHYPAPYAKAPEEPWPTTFSFKPLALRGKHGYLMKLNAVDHVDLILQLPSEEPGITPLAAIGLGKEVGLPRSGFLIDIHTGQINAQDWDKPIRDILRASEQTAKSSDAALPSVDLIKYHFGNFVFGDTQLHQLHGQARFIRPGVLDFSLAGEEIEGTMLWDFNQGEYGHVTARIDRYHAAKSLDKHFKEVAKINPQKTPMPSVDITVGDLAYGGANLGSLTLKASTPKTEQGTAWQIETLNLTNPDATLTANGHWSAMGTTKIEAKLDLIDVGAFLRRVNHPGIIAQGTGLINASLSWRGSPWDPLIETLQGTSSFNIRRGIVEQADLGVGGAFLSLVSFQSMLRRLTLDFFDFAHTSYTFDAFTGDIRLQNGIATTENIKCIGTKASIMLSGSADFAHSTIDAKALVVPDINAGGAAVSLAFINPVVGLGAFVGQWLLSHPLSKMMSTEYKISGALGNPTIVPVGTTKDNPDSQANAP